MPTPASQLALNGLRDLTMLKWYVIPLLAIVFYIYTLEIKKAKSSGNWDAIYAGLTLFGVDFFNETWNGWVPAFSILDHPRGDSPADHDGVEYRNHVHVRDLRYHLLQYLIR